MEINEIFFHQKKIRQINYLVISLVKCYFHEIFAKNEWVKVHKFRNFQTAVFQQKTCEISVFTK